MHISQKLAEKICDCQHTILVLAENLKCPKIWAMVEAIQCLTRKKVNIHCSISLQKAKEYTGEKFGLIIKIDQKGDITEK